MWRNWDMDVNHKYGNMYWPGMFFARWWLLVANDQKWILLICSTFAAKHVNDTPCRATRLRRTHVTSAIYANTGDITFGWSFQNPSPPRFTGGHVLLCASSRMGGHLRQRERKSQTTTPCIETHRTISYIIYFHIMSIDFALKYLQCISKFRFWVWTNP